MQSQHIDKAIDSWLQFGAVAAFMLLFLYGVIVLFKMYVKSRDGHEASNIKLAEEQSKRDGEWERKMVDVRAEYERKHREIADQYAKEVRELYEDSRNHEDTLRKEYADMLSGMAGDYTRSSAEIVRVLDKFYDRFVSPRARRKD